MFQGKLTYDVQVIRSISLIFAYEEKEHLDYQMVGSRKFYIRRKNNKPESIETGCIVIAHLLPWSDLEISCTPQVYFW